MAYAQGAILLPEAIRVNHFSFAYIRTQRGGECVLVAVRNGKDMQKQREEYSERERAAHEAKGYE